MSKRPHKYGAVPTEIDGIRFASKKEARRYAELKLLEKAKQIRCLRLQPRYSLMAPAGMEDGELMVTEVAAYVADFAYDIHLGGGAWRTVVEDVKGFKTPVYRLKKKWLKAQHGIEISEV
jgi:hypothetical protein